MTRKGKLKIVILVSIIFFIIYSYISFSFPTKFSWPDEASNYFFTKIFTENNELSLEEPLNGIAENSLHPRNAKVVGIEIVPHSFLGFYFISFMFAKLFSFYSVYFIVPLFSAISSIFFYLLVRKIFSDDTALISFIIFLTHPAVVYFSSLPFHHVMLFNSLFIISLYFLFSITNSKKVKLSNYVLWSIFLSLAILVRTSEIIWLLGLVIILLIYNRQKINKKYLIASLLIFVLFISPLLYFNNILYNNPLTVGYLVNSKNTASVSDTNQDFFYSSLKSLKRIISPNGIVINEIHYSSNNYLIKIFLFHFIISLLGLALIIFKYSDLKRVQKNYFLMFIGITTYLILYYGSGKYFGAGDDTFRPIIGSSHIRYWLPIYTLSAPIAGYFIIYLYNIINNKIAKNVFIFSFVLTLSIITLNTSYLDKEMGLIKLKSNNSLYLKMESRLNELTEENSIIVTSSTDKIAFPSRKVIELDGDIADKINKKLSPEIIHKLGTDYPVYHYAMFGIDFDNTNYILQKYNLKLTPVATIEDISSLYKFELL